MLADMVNTKGTVEETIKVNGVSLSMTKAQTENTAKIYSLKDIYEAFAGFETKTVATPVVEKRVAEGVVSDN